MNMFQCRGTYHLMLRSDGIVRVIFQDLRLRGFNLQQQQTLTRASVLANFQHSCLKTVKGQIMQI